MPTAGLAISNLTGLVFSLARVPPMRSTAHHSTGILRPFVPVDQQRWFPAPRRNSRCRPTNTWSLPRI